MVLQRSNLNCQSCNMLFQILISPWPPAQPNLHPYNNKSLRVKRTANLVQTQHNLKISSPQPLTSNSQKKTFKASRVRKSQWSYILFADVRFLLCQFSDTGPDLPTPGSSSMSNVSLGWTRIVVSECIWHLLVVCARSVLWITKLPVFPTITSISPVLTEMSTCPAVEGTNVRKAPKLVATRNQSEKVLQNHKTQMPRSDNTKATVPTWY